MATKWIDSAPAWAWGPRASNSKFGGGIILAGIKKVVDRLLAVKKLSKRLGLKGDEEVRSSGHILLEVKTEIKKYKEHNAPGAISFKELKAGIASGKFSKWVAMTAPQFGFRGAERGGMISLNKSDRIMARDLHIEAITRSQELEQAGLGAGVNIWWPAWTSRRLGNPKNPPMDDKEAQDLMLNFWLDVLKTTGGTMWNEWKFGDPGSDYLMTIGQAIGFCKTLNQVLGRPAMFINNEFAHILGSGISVADGVQQTVDAGLFCKFVHANSGQRLPVSIDSLLKAGVAPDQIPILIDWDWAVGVGGEATWKDQQEAIGIMDKTDQAVIYCEHDVNPSGLDPLKVFEMSIRNRQKMLEAVRSPRA
ncbi:MAG: hypothetical protein NT155_01155 [Candidatus Staskawiczbacteria bacterium]|nr:hypothetical protein [Candidatus Staskawiczbacteria bacterium]